MGEMREGNTSSLPCCRCAVICQYLLARWSERAVETQSALCRSVWSVNLNTTRISRSVRASNSLVLPTRVALLLGSRAMVVQLSSTVWRAQHQTERLMRAWSRCETAYGDSWLQQDGEQTGLH